ncbi:TonB-dependent receptor [Pseudokineococcus sp. 1T1Z-3]|uniref:TonB-dependent receptor n=1 Tax=Pseudokineococcus sp. 1T1Z-3 TaxID=3132745 RepID=UPI0030B06C12
MSPRSAAVDTSVDTLQKALRINLEPRWYGTIAEIGAGQEVARWFFRAGGAAGTVAKSMSAYDMAVSDAVYGRSERYVSRGRLEAMLTHELDLNVERLGPTRGDDTCFFAFADTVVARSYRGGNECHGWMGVRFQAHPADEPSQIVIHVRMLDDEAELQQEALGVVGVNLLHAAFFERLEPGQMVESLLDRLSTGRIEIDMIAFKGIEFRHVDNRLMALRLVQLGLSGVAMFGPDGEVQQPSEVLRKRPVLVERGSFRPPTVVNMDMLRCAHEKFATSPDVDGDRVLRLTELTMSNLLAGGADVDQRDFLARADLLGACGMTTLITDYVEHHRLAAYLSERTRERIGIVMGVPSLVDLFQEASHSHLPGGILESFGRLFKDDLKLFVYPMLDMGSHEVRRVGQVQVTEELQPLFDYLAGRGSFVDLDNFREDFLPILSRDVLRRIAAGDDSWEPMVPPEVADMVRRRGFFGHARAGS